jgi:hypothetical protein
MVISIIGQDLSTFHTALIKNKIVPILFNKTAGKNVFGSKRSELNKALNVIHGDILSCKKINIAILTWTGWWNLD